MRFKLTVNRIEESMMESEAKERMIQVCQSPIKMLEMAFQGFQMLTRKSIGEAENVKNEVQQYSSELANFLILF